MRCCAPARDAASEREPLAPAASHAKHDGFVHVAACEFAMGNDGPDANPGDFEGPVRSVRVDAFSIGAATVTNRAFAEFVAATGYVTDAERCGSSFVFYLQVPAERRATLRRVVQGLPWWAEVPGASWRQPEGAGSDVSARHDHPVVHVSWHDANAYCAWAQARLPSEAEWECAARGGLAGKRFAWGDELLADGVPRCNVFRGDFPNRPAPGWHPGTVEAASGEANGFGLLNACGNVWEWCEDWFAPGQRAMRGGSFLCHDSYCNRYRVAARGANTPRSTASNIGFRAVALT
jgi:formylglycine-generating enzyme required for sulfatase activity